MNTVVSYAFSTVALDMSNNEVFTCTKALQQPDADKFVEAMGKEVNDHKSCDHWEIIGRSTIPAGVKTIQAIWSFKRKRYLDGTLNKHKARLCAHGGMQQWGVSYWETYSPVVKHANYPFAARFMQHSRIALQVHRFCPGVSSG